MLTKYVKPNILQRLTWVAFGYYPEFHLEDSKTPMVTKDGSQLLAPSRPVMKKQVKSASKEVLTAWKGRLPTGPACLKLLPVPGTGKWGILGPCVPDDYKPGDPWPPPDDWKHGDPWPPLLDNWKPPPMKSGHSNTLSKQTLGSSALNPRNAAAALAKRYATNIPHLSSMNSNSSIGKVH